MPYHVLYQYKFKKILKIYSKIHISFFKEMSIQKSDILRNNLKHYSTGMLEWFIFGGGISSTNPICILKTGKGDAFCEDASGNGSSDAFLNALFAVTPPPPCAVRRPQNGNASSERPGLREWFECFGRPSRPWGLTAITNLSAAYPRHSHRPREAGRR